MVANDIVQAPPDKQQLKPMLSKLGALPKQLGRAQTLLADIGYFNAAMRKPAIKMARQPHHPPLAERFASAHRRRTIRHRSRRSRIV